MTSLGKRAIRMTARYTAREKAPPFIDLQKLQIFKARKQSRWQRGEPVALQPSGNKHLQFPAKEAGDLGRNRIT